MRPLIITIAIAILFVGCAKNPVAVPEPYNVTPTITVTSADVAWYDITEETLTITVNKTFAGNIVADTASLWITSYADTVFIKRAYAGELAGSWTWIINDDTYSNVTDLKLEVTYWMGTGKKSTKEILTVVRTGTK